MTTTEIRWGRCQYCGRWVKNLTGEACRACLKEITGYSKRGYGGRHNDEAHVIIVVSDPDPEYGFRPGASFSDTMHKANMAQHAYTPGTVLRNTETGAITVTK